MRHPVERRGVFLLRNDRGYLRNDRVFCVIEHGTVSESFIYTGFQLHFFVRYTIYQEHLNLISLTFRLFPSFAEKIV